MEKKDVCVVIENSTFKSWVNFLLVELGENVRKDFFTNTTLEKPDLYYNTDGWILGVALNKTQVTLKELITLILQEKIDSEKPKTTIWHCAEYELNKVPFCTSYFRTKELVEDSINPYMDLIQNVQFKEKEVLS